MNDLKMSLEAFNSDGGLNEFNRIVLECASMLNHYKCDQQAKELIDQALAVRFLHDGIVEEIAKETV